MANKKRNRPSWKPSLLERAKAKVKRRIRTGSWKRRNPPKTRPGKTGRWLKAKAVKVVRKNGKLTVMVKR